MRSLYTAVKAHSDLDDKEIIEAGIHGADAGFGGFTYNKDCIEFYDNNKDIIEEYVNDLAHEYGHMNNFALANTFNRRDMLDMGIDGYKVLMAWLVLEEVGCWLGENSQDEDDD